MARRSFVVANLALVSALSVVSAPSGAQQFDQTVRGEMRWRNIGPHRASRTKAVAGVPSQPHVFYIGVVNGGVWKTTDAGHTWAPIFDDQPTGSIGAVAVAPSDPNIVYVGSGEGLQRPDLSTGDGFYRSNDAGRTWTHLGLRDAQQITEILVDPANPNRVFVAVLGHPYGPNEERGVFRSTDGGRNFQKVLYKDEDTGASDLVFDPRDPNTLYATLWQARQGPWENGAWNGPNSGLFKSTDGGNTWHQLTKGLPTFEADGLGRIGIGVAPSDPRRLYAIVEARGASGGIYRSDDAGESWTRTAADTRVWTRPTDASEIVVDPRNADVVYSVTIVTWKSTDGGKTWTGFKGAPGGDDYQKAWFNPVNPDIMIMTSDQGAVVTLNGGQTWSSWYNQPTAQFYHVTTDNAFPYRVCSGQQESGSACVQSRGDHGQITFREWSPVGASEYSYVAPDPLDPDIVYGGTVNRFDRRTGQTQNVSPHPIRPADFRTLRTAPILFSPVDPRTLYFAGNTLWKTTNGGNSWTRISPDLTRTDSIVPPNVGVYSNTPTARARHPGVIYTIAPSYKSVNTIWAGTDDGLIHVTHDGGKTWKNVTPPDLRPWAKVSLMDASHTDTLSAYAAVNTFRLDELKPHIYRTRDGGKTWTHITKGIPDGGTVNVVREDPRRKGLLFAGTEQTVYVSIDDGDSWRSLRLNLPPTSIRDLVIKDDDVVVGTHGRSFWILDNITPLRQIADSLVDGDFLFRPQLATRFRWNKNTDTPLPPEEPAGQNPPDGAIIDYYLKNAASGSVVLEIADSAGTVIRRYNSDDTPEAPVDGRNFPDYWLRPLLRLSREPGMHRFVWDLRHAPPSVLAFTYPISATYRNTPKTPLGTWVMPGRYTAKLMVNRKTYTQPFNVRMDPRVKTPPAGLRQQYALSMSMYRLLERNLQAVREVRAMRQNLRMLAQRAGTGAVADSINALERRGGVLEGATGGGPGGGGGGGGDGERSLSQLNGNLASIYGILQAADVAPTTQVVAAVRDLERAAPTVVVRWETMKTRDVPALNAILAGANLPPLDPAQWR